MNSKSMTEAQKKNFRKHFTPFQKIPWTEKLILNHPLHGDVLGIGVLLTLS